LYCQISIDLPRIRGLVFDDEGLDKVSDLEHCRDTLLSTLDPFIRIQLQKRGISIIENTYTGLDTEYILKDSQKNLNELLSIQTAVRARYLIKIPLYNTYDISYVHPLTSEITTYYKPNPIE